MCSVSVSARSLAGVEDVVTVTQFRTLVVMDAHGELNLNGLAALLDVTPLNSAPDDRPATGG